jgi:hypothetical protein
MSDSTRELAQRSRAEQLRRKAAELRASAQFLHSAMSRSRVLRLAEDYEARAEELVLKRRRSLPRKPA